MTSRWVSFRHLALLFLSFTLTLGPPFKPFGSYAISFASLRPLLPFFITIPLTQPTLLASYHLSVSRVTLFLTITTLPWRLLSFRSTLGSSIVLLCPSRVVIPSRDCLRPSQRTPLRTLASPTRTNSIILDAC